MSKEIILVCVKAIIQSTISRDVFVSVCDVFFTFCSEISRVFVPLQYHMQVKRSVIKRLLKTKKKKTINTNAMSVILIAYVIVLIDRTIKINNMHNTDQQNI